MKTEIEKFSPCEEALVFRKKYKTFMGAWNNCPRGDWMLWIAQRLDVDIRVLTLAKGYCVKTVIHLMKDQRSKDAIEAAIAFGRNRINESQLKTAYAAAAYAYAAADAAYAYAAADAARTSTLAACAEIVRKHYPEPPRIA